MFKKRTLRAFEGCFWSLSLVCLALYGSHQFMATASTQSAKESFAELSIESKKPEVKSVISADGQIGLLRIVNRAVEAAIFNGTEDENLDKGIGRVRGTSYFELPGNVALAGHRDTFFRNLKDIEKGDVIEVNSSEGNFSYEVSEFFVVEPNNVAILKDTSEDTLTLITCYPFNFVGSAPQRFIVKARKRES